MNQRYMRDIHSNSLNLNNFYEKKIADLREQLSSILFNSKEFSGRVVAKLEDGSGDVLLPVDVRSICALPGLDVDQRHSCIERAEIL